MSTNIVVGLIGNTADGFFREIARIVEPIADAVVVRSTVDLLVERSVIPLSHVIAIQSNRHCSVGSLVAFSSVYPSVKLWHVRGPLVAPPVRLTPTGVEITDVSFRDCMLRLPGWLRIDPLNSNRDCQRLSSQSAVVLAGRFMDAEPIMDILEPHVASVQWRRTPPGIESRGSMVCIWDDSIAGPGSQAVWEKRLGSARRDDCRHIWMTSMATGSEIRSAWQAGVNMAIAKPFHGETLLAALQGP